MSEAWTVRSCIDAAGNHTCWDVCLPSRPDDRGVGVVASVFGDKQTAELIASVPRLAAALEIAASRFRFLAEMQRHAGRPESKGNASILERHADECLAAISKTRPPSGTEAQRATTVKQGVVHDGPTPQGDAPNLPPYPSTD